MSTNLNDRNAIVTSELAYLAGKLGKVNTKDRENLNKVFFDDNGAIREEIKADKDLRELAQTMQKDPNKYGDILNNYKLVGTANDTATGYLGVALQDLRNKSVTIGNAGTENGADIITDYQMAIGKVPNQLESANTFIKGLKETKINNENILSSTTTLNIA